MSKVSVRLLIEVWPVIGILRYVYSICSQKITTRLTMYNIGNQEKAEMFVYSDFVSK